MTALAPTVPEPRVLRTTTDKHRDCEGAGCFDCDYTGTILVEFVACPVHRTAVARNATGGLLGCCDGCAAETARALTLLSTDTTGRVDFPLREIADAARQEHST